MKKRIKRTCLRKKTSLAPGSKVVTEYLNKSGLTPYLDQLGFNTVGYGCTTCIGNSGPLDLELEKAIADSDLLVTSVLSGNRNFEGRIHPLVKANYLASPPLVVAYAIAGTVDIDLRNDVLGTDKDGNNVYFADIWPTAEEIEAVVGAVVTTEVFKKNTSAYLIAMSVGTKSKHLTKHCTHGIQSPRTSKILRSSKGYRLNQAK
ncbi:hypothetical protein GCM10020331_049980 [Ectobacillus funiculus]